MTLSPELLFGFALAQLLAAATPGPNFFLVTNIATSASCKHALLTACGIVASVLVWSVAVAAGLNIFFKAIRRFISHFDILEGLI